jgi:neopullulanase
MNYPLAEAIIGYAGGRSLNEALLRSHHEYGLVTRLDGPAFGRRLTELLTAYTPETNAVQLNLLGSHDTPRALSVLGGDPEALELAVLLQATLPGAPCIYYGDEVGVTGGIDPDSRRAFPWDATRWDAELLASVQASLALRHAEPALRSDELTITAATGAGLAFSRGIDRALAVALNPGDAPISLALGDASSGTLLLVVGRARTEAPRVAAGGHGAWIDLPPRSGAVVRLG